MINITINNEHGNKSTNMLINVKTVHDLVNHKYLLSCVSKLNLHNG